MSINIKKLNPWNWLRHEGGKAANVPVRRESSAMLSDPFWNMHREVDRLFDSVFSQLGGWPASFDVRNPGAGPMKPNLDIKETKKDYQIAVEIPGVEEKDVELELSNGLLTIKGEKKHEEKQEDDNYYCVERTYGSFSRSLALPSDAEEGGIEATFRNGVLTITVPRKHVAKQKEETKVISIKTAA